MKCFCGNPCLTFTNSSIGVRVWKCGTMKEVFVKESFIMKHTGGRGSRYVWVETGTHPCLFRKELAEKKKEVSIEQRLRHIFI